MSIVKKLTMQRAILVVEDDHALRQVIKYTLRGEGYFVMCLAEGLLAAEVAQDNPFSLILLDLMLQQPNGLDVYHQLRTHAKTKQIPILMIVPDECEITQQRKSELHADDYISKPLDLEELCSRVRALLSSGKRRQVKTLHRPWMKTYGEERRVLESQFLVIEEMRIDVAMRKITKGDQLVELGGPLLFDLLVYMVSHRGVVLTRERLLKQVWGYDNVSTSDTRTVDYHVRSLRKKLEDDPDNPQLIQTVRGVGYRFKA
jgi:DNA-binding response OmpR family regulator